LEASNQIKTVRDDNMKKKEESYDILNFSPFSAGAIEMLTAPMRSYFKPRAFGLDNINPEVPSLFVANHNTYAIDVALIMAEIYHNKGILPRGLGDKWHFSVPIWRDILRRFGGVDGSRENCTKLMEAGEHVMIFPGGGREALKRKGEAYQLQWKQRTGFVRFAVQYGYPIIPFCSVGGDNAFSIMLDGNDFLRSRLGGFLESRGVIKKYFKGGDLIPPIVRGIGPTMIPRPEPFYFSFGEPINTKPFKKKLGDKEALLEIRERVANSINTQIGDLQNRRKHDTRVGLVRRFMTRL
jgi:1-acyl-sn-glycerol-3-phosphate acyltransferase